MDIRTSAEIELLPLPEHMKERAKRILWERGLRALTAFLESTETIKSASEHDANEILKALYPDKNYAWYSGRLEVLRKLGLIRESGITKAVKKHTSGCAWCGSTKDAVSLCESCLETAINEGRHTRTPKILEKE